MDIYFDNNLIKFTKSMSIFNRIFNTKASLPPVNEPLPNVTINYNRRILTNSEQDIYKIYKDSSLLQSCVNLFTNEFLSAPLKPYVNEKRSENIALDIFTIDILKELIFQILLAGTGFLYKIRNSAGQLVNVQVLSGFHITKTFDTNGYIKDWTYQTAKGTFTLPPDDCIGFTWFSTNPDDKDFGISPILPVQGSATQIIELQRFVTEMTENDFVPRTILSAPTETNLTYAQQKLIMDSVREEFQNNNGSIKVLNGGWTLNRLSLGLDDLDISALRIVPETDICNSFQIPVTLIQTIAGQNNSTYNNVETARKFFIQNTISGFWSKIEQVINSNFSYEFPSQPEWFFETADLASMQEDNAEKFTRLNELFKSNVISRSEFRSELDLEDIDGGTQVYYQDLLFGSTTTFVEPEETITEPIVAVASGLKRAVKKKV
jgi:HK97 family phage portal protein